MIDLAEVNLMPLNNLEHAAECLRTIAHPHRLRIIQILLRERRSVGERAEACEILSNTASEHLRCLKDRGFLRREREGRRIFYYINEPALSDILSRVHKRFGCC